MPKEKIAGDGCFETTLLNMLYEDDAKIFPWYVRLDSGSGADVRPLDLTASDIKWDIMLLRPPGRPS